MRVLAARSPGPHKVAQRRARRHSILANESVLARRYQPVLRVERRSVTFVGAVSVISDERVVAGVVEKQGAAEERRGQITAVAREREVKYCSVDSIQMLLESAGLQIE